MEGYIPALGCFLLYEHPVDPEGPWLVVMPIVGTPLAKFTAKSILKMLGLS